MRIAIIGGIGSGKSEALSVAAELGLNTLSADAINAELLKSSEYTSLIAQTFPDAAADGAIDRKRLAEIVFSDGDARARLNALAHPRILERIRADKRSPLVVEMPLLVECGAAGLFDEIILISAPLPLRIERLEKRGMSREQAERRISAQADESVLRSVATRAIDNSSELGALRKNVRELLSRLTRERREEEYMRERCCCSKEAEGTVPIMRIIDRLDMLLAKDDTEGAGRLLAYWEGEARVLNDWHGLLEILSEEIGYCRSTGDGERGIRAVDEALKLLSCIDTGDSVANATVYLNCATTMKAFGKVTEALPYYERAREVYERLLPEDDFRLAGFYNNYAAALSELKRYAEAREGYLRAIGILEGKGFCELAVSYVNLAELASCEAQDNGGDCDGEVERLLDLAYRCLDDVSIERNAGYASVCRKCASAFGFFGYFIQKQELERRAQEIYDGNRN